ARTGLSSRERLQRRYQVELIAGGEVRPGIVERHEGPVADRREQGGEFRVELAELRLERARPRFEALGTCRADHRELGRDHRYGPCCHLRIEPDVRVRRADALGPAGGSLRLVVSLALYGYEVHPVHDHQ